MIHFQHIDSPVGRLFVVISLVLGTGALSTVWAWMAVDGHVTVLGEIALWVAAWAYMPMIALLPLAIADFPTGRVASRWLRPWLRVGVLAIGIVTVGDMVLPVSVNETFFEATNPWALAVPQSVAALVDETSMWVAIVLFALVSGDLIVRWRRARGVERLQMRWAGVGVLLCTLALVAAAVLVSMAL
jgi:hypothetical protein